MADAPTPGENRQRAVQIGVPLVIVTAICLSVFVATGGTGEGKKYTIAAADMEPTLSVNDEIRADARAYDDSPPEIGDIVVFNPPGGVTFDPECAEPPPAGEACATNDGERSRLTFFKRVVAGPGDTFALKGGHAIVNGKQVVEDFIAPCRTDQAACDFPKPITIPEGEFMLLGDNRGASDDSRFWGPVPEAWILAKVQS